MSRIDSIRRKPRPAAAAVLVLLLACLGLAACGGSSSSSSGTTATTSASTGTGAKGANAGRFAAVRECLQKNGITLPKRTPGQKRPNGGAGGFLGGGGAAGGAGSAGGPQLPKGVTRAQYEAALKKCGAGKFSGRSGGGARFKSPAFQAALAKFATCMRENGVNVPAPNTSGNGPVFDTKGIDTTSAKFKAAEAKCQSDLSGAFRRGQGAGGSATGGGGAGGDEAAPGAAPPSSGEAPGGAAGPPPAG
jgi:hypothetical protein